MTGGEAGICMSTSARQGGRFKSVTDPPTLPLLPLAIVSSTQSSKFNLIFLQMIAIITWPVYITRKSKQQFDDNSAPSPLSTPRFLVVCTMPKKNQTFTGQPTMNSIAGH